MSDRLLHARLVASVSEVVDAGIDLLPHFEMAAIPVLENTERPAEVPELRRVLRAEGIRPTQHRGVLLLEPGALEHLSTSGFLKGMDELYLLSEWNEEFEAFQGRITVDAQDFNETTPLGLEEWVIDTGCLLALGDGGGLNFATLDGELADRLCARFKSAVERAR